MRTDTYLLRLGEVTLKKKNRSWFIKQLVKVIQPRIRDLDADLQVKHKKLLLKTEAPPEKVRDALSTVFGLVGISPILRVDLDMDTIKSTCLEIIRPYFGSNKTFAVKAKRVRKDYPMTSPEIQRELAGFLFENGLNLDVDLKHPDLCLSVSIEFTQCWISLETWPGLGGLPVTDRNRYGLLLSGGIDSPVAGNMIQRRGGYLEAIYFHTPPFTVESAKDKVIDLAEILARFQNGMKLHIVNFSEVMKTIKATCSEPYMVVLSRRFMIRVAERILRASHGHALVTGENLGQVASQTIENITVVNDVAALPILRPLIGLDKQDIITWARKMGSFETSIRPYQDCCSLFAPDEPVTRASSGSLLKEETALDVEAMVEQALAQTETMQLD